MNCYSNQTRSGFYALRNKAASFESDYEPVKKNRSTLVLAVGQTKLG